MASKNIGKKKSIKCWSVTNFKRNYEYSCGYSQSYVNHYDYSMNRIYVKDNKSFKTIGYYCKKCGKIITDKELKELNKKRKFKFEHQEF